MTALHHVQVSCPKGGEPAVSRFYADLLGLVEVAKPSELAKRGGVWFRGDGYELHVGWKHPSSRRPRHIQLSSLTMSTSSLPNSLAPVAR
ncbi:MAG: hypothetical protein WKF73_02680 [Nocardioidaceae bacterium]